jgi:hypothetical protein
VKRKLLIFLMLLAGYAYLASALEMDRDECKKNFNSEQQYKIATEKNDHINLLSASAFDLPLIYYCYFNNYPATTLKSAKLVVKPFPDPPDRLFIKHSLLLI